MTPARHKADYHPETRAESAAHVASGHTDSIIPGVSALWGHRMTTSTQVLRTHLDTADRNWFAAHPSAQWRKRRYVPGEDVGEYRNDLLACQFRVPTHTAVFRRDDGALVYRYFRAVEA